VDAPFCRVCKLGGEAEAYRPVFRVDDVHGGGGPAEPLRGGARLTGVIGDTAVGEHDRDHAASRVGFLMWVV
jgi:hypothetical protein